MTNKYQCENGHIFLHPAKETDHILSGTVSLPGTMHEISVCPFCFDKSYWEVVDSQPEHVYIYDLTSGAQTELDKLLAEGYQVVARYSKQYHLEKPKETKP